MLHCANLQPVHPAQHEDGKEEHDEVARHHLGDVEKDGLRADVGKAPGGARKDLGPLQGDVEGCVDEQLLPVQSCCVGVVELYAAALCRT